MKEGDFMKVYSKEDLDTYITSVVRDEDGENYVITFADGEVYDNVPVTEDNTQKIEDRLIAQANSAIDQKMKLVRDQKIGTIARTFFTVVTGVTAGLATFVYTGDPVIVAAASGVIVLGGGAWIFRHKQVVDAKIKEIENFEQRLSKHTEMDEYLDSSPNAYRYLDGGTLDDKTDRMDYVQGMKEEGRNPFGLIEIENGGITGEEIENLSYGMERERKLGLTYVKTNSK